MKKLLRIKYVLHLRFKNYGIASIKGYSLTSSHLLVPLFHPLGSTSDVNWWVKNKPW
jgi:hypothetical protein